MPVRHIGIDLALTTAHKAVVVDDLLKVKTLSVPMEHEGFEAFVKAATSGASGPCHFVLEPTGNMWPLVGALLRERGYQVSLVTGYKTAGARRFLSRHCKTDVTDGEAIARVAILDPKNGTYPLPELGDDRMVLKRLVSRRDQLVKDASRCKYRIEASIQGASPHLLEALGTDKFSAANRVYLRNFLDPFEASRLGVQRLEKAMRAKGATRVTADRVETLYLAAVSSAQLLKPLQAASRIPIEIQQLQDEVNDGLDILEMFETKIEALAKRIDETYREVDPSEALRSIPSFGNLTAATLEAYVGAVSRFRSARDLVSYCGLAPKRRQTGKSEGTKGLSITKAGQPILRRYLYLAARRAVLVDPEMHRFYERLRGKGKHHNTVMIALAHKLARQVYAVLKRRVGGTTTFEIRTPEGVVVSPEAGRKYIQDRKQTSEATSAEDRPAERVSGISGQSRDSTTPSTAPAPVGLSVAIKKVIAKARTKATNTGNAPPRPRRTAVRKPVKHANEPTDHATTAPLDRSVENSAENMSRRSNTIPGTTA